MRQIKFRGRDIETGEYVYGDYCKGLSSPTPAIRSWAKLKYVSVLPESVAQLVGYDKNGAEVYEGDLVVNLEYNCLLPPVEATFCHYAGILDGDIVLAEETS